LQRLLDAFAAGPWLGDLSEDELALHARSAQHREQLLTRFGIMIEKDGSGAFPGAGSHNCRANALCAARYQDHFSF
jgi:hypothetical protein